MTGPTPGYPDFQSASNLTNLAVAGSAVHIPSTGTVVLYNQTTPQFKHAWLTVLNTTGFFTLRITYFQPGNPGNQIIQQEFVCAIGVTNIIIPNLMAAMAIELLASSIPGGENTTFGLGFTNSFSDGYHWLNPDNFIALPSTSIGAGATNRKSLRFVQPGPAQVTFNSSDTTGSVAGIVGVFNTTGAVDHQLLELDPIPFSSNAVVYLPPAPCFIEMVNLTGAAITGSYSMSCSAGMY